MNMLEKIILQTATGEKIATEYVRWLNTEDAPPLTVVRWGSRVFQLTKPTRLGATLGENMAEKDCAVYTEVLCFDIPQPEFWLKFHRMTAVTQEHNNQEFNQKTP